MRYMQKSASFIEACFFFLSTFPSEQEKVKRNNSRLIPFETSMVVFLRSFSQKDWRTFSMRFTCFSLKLVSHV